MSLEFLGVVGGAIMLKLVSSADDVVWLTRLLYGMRGWRLSLIHAVYIATLCLICLLAYIIAQLGIAGSMTLTGEEGWFSLIASCLLILFALTVLRGEIDEEPNLSPDDRLVIRARDAFFISFIGSIDELTVYTVALSTGEIPMLALVPGSIIAGTLTLLVAHGVGRIHIVSRHLEEIPIWIIIAVLGIAGVGYSSWELLRG